MRRVILFLSLSMASSAFAQGSFEGVVTFQSTNKDSFTYFAKGNKVRIEPNDAKHSGAALLIDGSGKSFTMVMPEQKVYMTVPMNQGDTHVADTVRGKVTKVGSETVAGVPCDDYQGTDAKGQKQDTFCVAHGMGNFVWGPQGNNVLARMAPHISGLSDAISGGAFPLKVVNKEGQTTFIATKIEKKSLDDALFSPPAGYTQMNMPAGMQPH
jgi:Domain of unknown function (DUF4412)